LKLEANFYSVAIDDDDDDDHDQLYVLIRHDLLVYLRQHPVYFYDGDGDDDEDVERELVALHIQVQKERRQHWQSADQSL
jgi:hypothetical protein